MNIIGPDELVFGVEDLQSCQQFLRDYGLAPASDDDGGSRFERSTGRRSL